MKTWLAVEAPKELLLEREFARATQDNATANLNAVPLTGAQLQVAAEAISHIEVRSLEGVSAHARLLQKYARSLGFNPETDASAAMHARIVAFDKWCGEFDPRGATDRDAAFEAAARMPLINGDHGVAFEPVSFMEMVEFVTELPF